MENFFQTHLANPIQTSFQTISIYYIFITLSLIMVSIMTRELDEPENPKMIETCQFSHIKKPTRPHHFHDLSKQV